MSFRQERDLGRTLSQRDTLPEGKWKCAPMEVLSSHDREVLRILLSVARRESEWVWVGSPLTAVAGMPVGVPNEYRKTVVRFAIVDVPRKETRCVALDESIDSGVVDVLKSNRVPFVILDASGCPDSHAAMVIERARSGDRPYLSGRLHWSQHVLSRHLMDALWVLPKQLVSSVKTQSPHVPDRNSRLARHMEANSWMVLEEVSLQRIVNCSDRLDQGAAQFLLQSSVDTLIVDMRRDRVALPLLAMEFDGPHHEKTAEKDRLKTALLHDAGIPLIRIGLHEVDPKHLWDRAGSETRARMSRYLEPMKRLVRRMVNEESFSWGYAQEVDRANDRLLQLLDELAVATFDKNYGSLTEGQREVLFETDAAYELWVERQRVDWEYANHEPDVFGECTLEGALIRAKVDRASVVSFELVSGPGASMSARGKCRLASGLIAPVEVGPVAINMPTVEMARIERLLRDYVTEQFAVSVAEVQQSVPF